MGSIRLLVKTYIIQGYCSNPDNCLPNRPSGPLREKAGEAEWSVGLRQYDFQPRLFIYFRNENFYNSISPFPDFLIEGPTTCPQIRLESTVSMCHTRGLNGDL